MSKKLRNTFAAICLSSAFFAPSLSFADDSSNADASQQERDMDVISKIDPNNEYQAHVAEVIKFVDANANMAGAVGACIPEEEIDVELCSNMILSHWKDIYGYDIPHLKTQDGKTEKDIVKRAWNNQRSISLAVASQHKEKCASYIAEERKSPIWNFCKRKQLPDNPYESFQELN